MSVAVPVVLSIVAVAFQALAAPSFSLAQTVPHFPLLLVSYTAARRTFREALTTALASGLLLDALSLDPWGASSVSFVALVFVFRWAARSGWLDSPVPWFVATGFAILVAVTLRAGVVSLLGGRSLPLGPVLGVGAYTWLLAIPGTTILDGIRLGEMSPGRRGTW